MSRWRLMACFMVAVLLPAIGAAQRSETPQALYEQAVAAFASGNIPESVMVFDTLARLVPSQAPALWQRGIALYYAGRFEDCRMQFESHRTVNPDDVENAAWHFLCVARARSVTAARAALLPVGPDARVPMREVYRMFRGELELADVLAAAGSRPDGQFYAHLYIGLYSEALGLRSRARDHLGVAAEERYAGVGGYMHMVARVHVRLIEAGP
jgi:tetratricopeptide (TPR) repeat protein